VFIPMFAAVFCIMDYWTFDWYIELKKYLVKNIGALKKTVFPGMELRVECPVDYRLNIHCILSDELSIQELSDFKSELYIRSINKKLSNDALIQFAKSLDDSKAEKHGFTSPNSMIDEKLLQLGSQTAEITKESLQNAFDQIPQDTGFIILPYDTSDGLLKLNWEEHPHDDNFFMQSAHIFETREQKNIDLISGRKTPENESFFENFYKTLGNKAKPCVSGSDAHKYSDYAKFPSNRITWIKSNPTFEGLKQILYEPTERVLIQETNPDFNFDKPLFTSIKIDDELKVLKDGNSHLYFEESEIPINRNLISIIGGRGQGKSMLINYLGFGLKKEIPQKLKEKINLSDSFKIGWQQSFDSENKIFELNQQTDIPFTFIFQSKVKDIADNEESLKQEILEMLIGAGFEKPKSKYDEIEIKEKLQEYWNIREWLEKKDDDDNSINTARYVQSKIDDVQGIINLTTEGSNKDLLAKYVTNISSVKTIKVELKSLRDLREDIIEYRDTINAKIKEIEGVTLIDTETQQKEIVSIYREKLKKVYILQSENEKIKEENFKDYKGDLSQLLSNLTNYQKEISEFEEKLKYIESRNKEFKQIKEQINEVIKYQKQILLKEAIAITDTWKNKIFDNKERRQIENQIIKKILADRNIKIEGTIFFNGSQFLHSLDKYIDGRTLRSKNIENVYKLLEINGDNASQDVLDITIDKIEKIRSTNPSSFYDGIEYDILKVFLEPEFRAKYMNVFPSITIDGKELNDISAGQKGTVYLCLKLATQLFTGPIVFDQPEDDLDNDFITNQLIDLFKEIKQFRQVIIVSHNANLVVNSDSEQIIIAFNHNEKLSYKSGSLEDSEINKEICRILEGGEKAFEKRRNKYRYVK
jgi:hypothetical protein